MEQDPFKEYLIQTEPDKKEKGYAWHTAIGLQAVDGLKTSEYLVSTAIQNIEVAGRTEEDDMIEPDQLEEHGLPCIIT